MKKVQKGQPGYFKYRKIQTGIAMASGYLLVLLLFFTGIFIFADRGNLFTVVAIASMLPTAKMTVNFLMYPKKGKADSAEFDELCHNYPKLTFLADILITPEKKIVEFPYTAVTRSHLIIYCNDKKLDESYHGKYIRQFLKNDDINADVSFYSDLNKFKKRLASISVNEPEEYSTEEQEQIEKIVNSFKIMSI